MIGCAGKLLPGRKKNGMRRDSWLSLRVAVTNHCIWIFSKITDVPTVFAAMLFVTGLFLSIGYSAYMAYPMMLATKETFPIANAIVNTGGQIGGACAPLAAGFMLEAESTALMNPMDNLTGRSGQGSSQMIYRFRKPR